nr:MAG TPA: Nitrile hydratase, alpha chain [Caudoviricetes sp.]
MVEKDTNTKNVDNVVAFSDKGSKEMNRSVKRKEMVEVMEQVFDRMNETNRYLMEDINTMYRVQLFPFQMMVSALENLLIEKGVITKEELDAKLEENKQELIKKARAMQETEDGNVEVVSKEEDELLEKEKVVKALASDTEDK